MRRITEAAPRGLRKEMWSANIQSQPVPAVNIGRSFFEASVDGFDVTWISKFTPVYLGQSFIDCREYFRIQLDVIRIHFIKRNQDFSGFPPPLRGPRLNALEGLLQEVGHVASSGMHGEFSGTHSAGR